MLSLLWLAMGTPMPLARNGVSPVMDGAAFCAPDASGMVIAAAPTAAMPLKMVRRVSFPFSPASWSGSLLTMFSPTYGFFSDAFSEKRI
jgi:hypothetical protein